MKIRGAIFDWGGVLIDDPREGMVQYCSEKLGVPPDRFREAHQMLEPEFQLGRLSEEEYVRMLCRRLGPRKDTEEVRGLWGNALRHNYRPRASMLELVASLESAGYGLALLSNTEPPAVTLFHELNYSWFDAALFSCIEGLRKPDPRLFDRTIKKLVLHPAETIFIDDRPEYVEGARATGIHAILYESFAAILLELGRLGVYPKRSGPV